MIIQYHPRFLDKLKSVNVRIRKSFKEKIKLFRKDPDNAYLNNHELKEEYAGFRSIDITNDYRAIYKEIVTKKDLVVYFILLGTHGELYGEK